MAAGSQGTSGPPCHTRAGTSLSTLPPPITPQAPGGTTQAGLGSKNLQPKHTHTHTQKRKDNSGPRLEILNLSQNRELFTPPRSYI